MTDTINVTALSEAELANLLRGRKRGKAYQDNAGLFWAIWKRHAPDLPEPQPEYRFQSTRKWRFDWAFSLQKLAVEVDGIIWQAGGGRHNTDKDREKMNHAAALGWRVMHFSAKQLNDDPLGCVELVIRALSYK